LHLPLTVSDGRSALGAFGVRLLAVGAALAARALRARRRWRIDVMPITSASLKRHEVRVSRFASAGLRPPGATCGV
jgi:hypothetical protein